MPDDSPLPRSRRAFVGGLGQLGLAAVVSPRVAGIAARTPARAPSPSPNGSAPGEWDLSWIARLEDAPDRAVVDTTAIGGGFVLQIATRYLDNCDAVYGAGKHRARVVLNLRVRAVALGVNDGLWSRHALGVEYEVKDPVSQQPATRNIYMTPAAGDAPGSGSIKGLVDRGAVILVCDFALGHLAARLATKSGRTEEEVHRELGAGLVDGAFLVPSGIFGLARAQNAGCAYLNA
jgi:hypothetical protein